MQSDPFIDVELPTTPCLPTFPKLQAGYAFCAEVPGQIDIDLIGNDNWEIIILGMDIIDQPELVSYIGQTHVDDVYCYVWWCQQQSCFLAQTAFH